MLSEVAIRQWTPDRRICILLEFLILIDFLEGKRSDKSFNMKNKLDFCLSEKYQGKIDMQNMRPEVFNTCLHLNSGEFILFALAVGSNRGGSNYLSPDTIESLNYTIEKFCGTS
jgi:hypothetical protein